MSSKPTVAVTCASSRMGQATVRELMHGDFKVRTVSRSREIFAKDEFRGVTLVDGDFGDVAGMTAAFEGVDAILSALPSLAGEKAIQYAHNFVAAAKAAGVR